MANDTATPKDAALEILRMMWKHAAQGKSPAAKAMLAAVGKNVKADNYNRARSDLRILWKDSATDLGRFLIEMVEELLTEDAELQRISDGIC